MQDSTNTGRCRYCDATIFWFKSRRGKNYPCDSDDRRDFHQCTAESDTPSSGAELRTIMQLVITTGYRTLATKFHPDHGGRLHDMQNLNAAVEQLRRVTA